jgi:hypothetical protein
MAVVRLSRMITVENPRLYTMSIRGVIPEWMKVESPMTATTFPRAAFPSAFSIPKAFPREAPMQTQVSIPESGGSAARV